jgi:YfiH family protein
MSTIQPKYFKIFAGYSIIHANSTRHGGISKGLFASLNLGSNTNDSKADVEKNREIYFKHLGIERKQIAFPGQVHSDNVEVVEKPGIFPQTDALITNKPNIFLSIQTADCFPVFVYNPKEHVCALIHSGWRGTAMNITGKVLEIMNQKFKCQHYETLIGIGAGISQKNYQVDDKTAQNFGSRYLIPDGPGHYKLNVIAAIKDQLVENGIPKNQIESASSCTFEDKDNYYSYRRDAINSGRMMGIMGLR